MLAFDIETTGLDPTKNTITVVALYGTVPNSTGKDPRKHIDQVLNFARDGLEPQKSILVDALNSADVLCAFNGVRFDIPFIFKSLNIPPTTASSWVVKLYDPFEENKLMNDKTISLNKMLSQHNMQVKCGSGMEAVNLALSKQWDELEFYCRQDSLLTHQLATKLLQTRNSA